MVDNSERKIFNPYDKRTMFDLIDEFEETWSKYYYNSKNTEKKQGGEKAVLKAPQAMGGGTISGATHGVLLETVLNLMTLHASSYRKDPQKAYFIDTSDESFEKETDECSKQRGFTLKAKDLLAYITFLTKYRGKEGTGIQMTSSGDFLMQHLRFAKIGVTSDNDPKNKEKYVTTVATNLPELEEYWQKGYIPNIVPSYGFKFDGIGPVPTFEKNDMTIQEFVKMMHGLKFPSGVKDNLIDEFQRQNPMNYSEFKNHQDFYKLRSKLNLPIKQQDLLTLDYEKTTNKKMLFYDRLFEKAAMMKGDAPDEIAKA